MYYFAGQFDCACCKCKLMGNNIEYYGLISDISILNTYLSINDTKVLTNSLRTLERGTLIISRIDVFQKKDD